MFKFGFDEENENEASCDFPAVGSPGACAQDLEWLAAEEVHLTERAIAAGGKPVKKVNLVSYGQLQLTYVATDDAVASLAELPGQELIAEAETLRSDLLPAKYEGGLKIWECTHDLANFLASQPDASLSGRKVLDLGCGAGLLGLLAASQGASEVHFQDYMTRTYTKKTHRAGISEDSIKRALIDVFNNTRSSRSVPAQTSNTSKSNQENSWENV
ncbi:histidine protein methyltransferase 1 homolog isoform X6 [Bacillus rossius redtenbacheri]|uniref:histidine protein methyltransferase 1 homolog isoform X6 n=1 Tax=Bacillus rossius redtenbacheri TaxID=93214 RepID=UPI002FDD58C5